MRSARQLAREHARLLGQAVVGEVAGEQQHIGGFRDLREQRLKSALRGLRAVKIANRGDAHDSSHTPRSTRVEPRSAERRAHRGRSWAAGLQTSGRACAHAIAARTARRHAVRHDWRACGGAGVGNRARRLSSARARDRRHRRRRSACWWRGGCAREIDELSDHYAALLHTADEQSRRAEAANRLKDEFLATLSHELRTPLNSVLGWARLLASGKLDKEQTTRAVQAIERAGWAQSRLIEDLLDISRIVGGKLKISPRPTAGSADRRQVCSRCGPPRTRSGIAGSTTSIRRSVRSPWIRIACSRSSGISCRTRSSSRRPPAASSIAVTARESHVCI